MPGRVLVVDSDFGARIRAVGALVAAGYELSVADNPWEAMRVATAESPELVLIGDALARESGPALVGRLFSAPETSTIPVLVVADDEATRLAADRAGARVVLSGPLGADDLAAAVGEHIGDRRPLAGAPASLLGDDARLAAVEALRADLREGDTLDRFTALARDMLGVPVSTISLMTDEEQVWLSRDGVPEPWSTIPASPLNLTYCQFALTSREPLRIDDANAHPLVSGSPAIAALQIVAYLGIPIITGDGHAVGTFCAVDSTPRAWTDREVGLLEELGGILTAHFDDVRRQGRHTA